MERKKVIEKLGQYLNKWDIEYVNAYLDAKDVYLSHKSTDTLAELKMAYEPVYFAVKHVWIRGEMTRKEFDDLIDLIQEGLD